MIPLALGLVIGAVSSIKLVEKLGTTQGRDRRPARARRTARLQPVLGADMPYWPLGLWFFGVALSIGWIMGPATESIMGAVPEEKSGVASAMNDVTRQVAGALGTAVIGSIITSLYASRIGDSVAALPEQARVAAEDSIGQANAIAATAARRRRARASPRPRPTRSPTRSASASPSPAPPRCSRRSW